MAALQGQGPLAVPDATFRHILGTLAGQECAALGAVCRLWGSILGDDSLWIEHLERLARKGLIYEPPCDTARQRFRKVAALLGGKGGAWARVPHQGLHPTEGCPHLFLVGSRLCCFGGFGGYGPHSGMDIADMSPLREWLLHGGAAGAEAPPLRFQRLAACGQPASPAYNQSCTPVGLNTVVVVGGFRRGGYQDESHEWAVATLSDDGVAWRLPERAEASRSHPKARGGHSATYIPAEVIQSHDYASGILLVFGGNINGEPTNSVDILDLHTWEWSTDVPLEGERPQPRNSHSATLLGSVESARLVVVGGGDGSDVPRAGSDFSDVAILNLRDMRWEAASPLPAGLAVGRAHVAISLGEAVITFGGGRLPSSLLSMISATATSTSGRNLPAEPRPDAVAFHGATSLLPLGLPMLVAFGGWHPREGTSGALWACKLDGVAPPSRAEGEVASEEDCMSRRFMQLAGTACDGEEDEPDVDEGRQPMVRLPNGMVVPVSLLMQMLNMQRRSQGQETGGDDADAHGEGGDDGGWEGLGGEDE